MKESKTDSVVSNFTPSVQLVAHVGWKKLKIGRSNRCVQVMTIGWQIVLNNLFWTYSPKFLHTKCQPSEIAAVPKTPFSRTEAYNSRTFQAVSKTSCIFKRLEFLPLNSSIFNDFSTILWTLVAFSALTVLGGHQEERLACKKIELWDAGVVICLEQGASDLHMVQPMPLPPDHLLLH